MNRVRALCVFATVVFVALALSVSAGAVEFNAKGDPAVGPADAPVTILLFYDFQCGHCANASPRLLKIQKQYGDLVRLVAVNVPAPGHPYARTAAVVAMAAGEKGKFWEAFHILFQDQSKFSEEYFADFGHKVGVPQDLIDKQREAGVYDALLRRNFVDAVNLGVEYTPTVWVGDTKLVGAKKNLTYMYHINELLAARGIESPVGPVEKPADDSPAKQARVPAGMIYPVEALEPVDSKLKVKVGDKAPDFTLPIVDPMEDEVTLSDYLGKKNVVLSFVPAAWTPVCSAQWPEYAQNKRVFDDADTFLIGISVDNVPSLYAWTSTMGVLWFPVTSDFWPHGKVAKKYGVLRSSGVSERAVFLIDKKGIVRYVDVHDINTMPDFEVLKKELKKLDD